MFGRDPPDEDMFQSLHPESHEIEDNHETQDEEEKISSDKYYHI